GLYFIEGGRAALVFVWASVWAYDTGSRSVQAAYRVPLEGAARPELLFSEEGFELHSSSRGAALVIPTSWRMGCTHQGCPVDRIVTFELVQGRMVKKTIFDDKRQRVDSARIV